MPFRNPITTLGGVLVLPAMQSPDYSKISPDGISQSLDITGWQLNNQPSEVNAETVTAEKVYIKSYGGQYRLTDVAVSAYRGLPEVLQVIQGGVANPIPLTTVNQNISGPAFFSPAVQAGVRFAGTESIFNLRGYSVIQTTVAAPTAIATVNLVVQEYDSLTNLIATTTLATPAFSRQVGNQETATVAYEWVVATTAGVGIYDLVLNPNTYFARASLAARASLNGQVRAITTSSKIIVDTKNLVLWTQ